MRHCVELGELLSAYADSQTVPAQTELIETHLASCVACRGALRRLRETALLLKFDDDDWSPPDLRLRVAHAYAGKRSGQSHISVVAVLTLAIASIVVAFQIGPASQLATPSAPFVAPTSTMPTNTACGWCMPTPPASMHRVTVFLGAAAIRGLIAANPTAQSFAGARAHAPTGASGTRGSTPLRTTVHIRGVAPIPI